MRVFQLTATVMAAAACLTAGAELGCRVDWRVDGAGGFSAVNALCDPDTGAARALVACEGARGVACIDLAGNRLWEYAMEPPVSASPAVGDLDGDGAEDVVAADSKGNIVALTGDGAVLWTALVPAGVVGDSCPAIADLDDDGRPEILVGDTSGTLSCLDNNGRVRWQFTGDGTQMGPVLVADIYNCPGREIVVTSHDCHVYLLDANGAWLWDKHFPKDLFPNSTPLLADVDGDGVPELYVGGGLNHLYGIDLATREVIVDINTFMHVNSALAASDLDRDGKDEVVFSMKSGGLWCLSADGIAWQQEFTESGFHASPNIVDVDGDPELEVIQHSSRGDLKVIDADGTVLLDATTGCSVLTGPLAGDLDGDGMLELVASRPAGYSNKGEMIWIELGVPFRDEPGNRTVFAGNRAHSGAKTAFQPLPTPVLASAPSSASSASAQEPMLFSGENTWRFDIANPDQQRLVLLTSIVYPDGSARRFARHVFGAAERKAVSFDVAAPGAYTISDEVVDADALNRCDSEAQNVTFGGFATERAYLEDEVFAATEERLNRWESTNPACAEHMRREVLSLRGMLIALADEAEADRVAHLALVRAKADRLRALSDAAIQRAPSGSFFTWAFNPWAYFHPRRSLPGPDETTSELSAALCVEEYESLALNVTNVSGETLEVRVLCDGLVNDATGEAVGEPLDHLAFRRAVVVPTLRRKQIADALPMLDQGSLLTIAPLESQQLWITMNAKNLDPGGYTAQVRLKSVEPDPTVVTAPVHITVHDLALPRPRPLRFCLWTFEQGSLGCQHDYVLEDLVEHGTTIFFGKPPRVECTAAGEFVGEIDFTPLDACVERYSPHGMLLFMGGHGGLTGQPVLSDGWNKAFVPYMRAWAEHMKELGLDYGDWAFYPYDEPSTPFAEATVNLAKMGPLVREADPRILIYTDPTCGTNMDSMDLYKNVVDIWCPSNQLLDRNGEEVLRVAREYGKEVWNYDARGRAKTLSSLGHYRWWLWNAWNLDLTGAGWFTYALHGNAERWDGPNDTGDLFCTVYEGANAVVSSKRWEVTREGIEDYEYLYLLREAIRGAEARGVPADKLAQAKALLTELPPRMETTLRQTGERLPLDPDGVAAYEAATERLDRARQEIVAMCIALRGM